MLRCLILDIYIYSTCLYGMYITPPWPFWVNSDPSLSRSLRHVTLRYPEQMKAQLMKKLGERQKVGPGSTYKCGYNPYNHYKRAYKWVTGVKTPRNGVRTVLITGRGPPCSLFFSKFNRGRSNPSCGCQVLSWYSATGACEASRISCWFIPM